MAFSCNEIKKEFTACVNMCCMYSSVESPAALALLVITARAACDTGKLISGLPVGVHISIVICLCWFWGILWRFLAVWAGVRPRQAVVRWRRPRHAVR